MLKSEIKIGAKYLAKVNGKRQVVIVDDIITNDYSKRSLTRYAVKNLATNRWTYFRSAAKFIEPVIEEDDNRATRLVNEAKMMLKEYKKFTA